MGAGPRRVLGAHRVPRRPRRGDLKARLSDAFDRFLEGVADNRQVTFDDDGWRLKTDPAEQPDPAQSDRLAELHRWLDARNRTIRLADLLIEVENDLGFSAHFQQPGERVDPGEVCALLAAILAHGCNLGLYTMEKVAPDIAYRRLKYVSDWRLVEENQRAALAAIVHGISRLDAAGHWGDGTTSASDGQRFAMPHKVLQRTYSTRFNDFALEFYSSGGHGDAGAEHARQPTTGGSGDRLVAPIHHQRPRSAPRRRRGSDDEPGDGPRPARHVAR